MHRGRSHVTRHTSHVTRHTPAATSRGQLSARGNSSIVPHTCRRQASQAGGRRAETKRSSSVERERRLRKGWTAAARALSFCVAAAATATFAQRRHISRRRESMSHDVMPHVTHHTSHVWRLTSHVTVVQRQRQQQQQHCAALRSRQATQAGGRRQRPRDQGSVERERSLRKG